VQLQQQPQNQLQKATPAHFNRLVKWMVCFQREIVRPHSASVGEAGVGFNRAWTLSSLIMIRKYVIGKLMSRTVLMNL